MVGRKNSVRRYFLTARMTSFIISGYLIRSSSTKLQGFAPDTVLTFGAHQVELLQFGQFGLRAPNHHIQPKGISVGCAIHLRGWKSLRIIDLMAPCPMPRPGAPIFMEALVSTAILGL